MEKLFETERLILRKPTLDDAAFMLRITNEPTWLQYIGDRKVRTLEDARMYLLNGTLKSFETNGFGFGIVELKSTGESIGMCGLVKRDFLEDVDLGFAFFPEHTRQGYAYEISKAMLIYAQQVYGMNKLVAITTQNNASSIRLLNKLGFMVDSIIRHEGEDLFLFKWQKTMSFP